jgi:hypothetical protein
MDERIAGPYQMEASRTLRTWSIAYLIAVMLFFVPFVNGALAGAFGASRDSGVKRTLGHAVATSLLLIPLLWVLAAYPVKVFAPFGLLHDQVARTFFCVLPLIVTSAIVSALRLSQVASRGAHPGG